MILERQTTPAEPATSPVMETPRYPLIPYPTGWQRAALRSPLLLYRLGLGGLLNTIHLMVLTTRGRKSGQARHIPIEYRRHGKKIYLVSGWGGRPQWYQNIMADPTVTIRLGAQVYAAKGSIVTDSAEALRALYLFRRIAPARYDAVLGRLVEAPVNAKTLPDLSHQFTIIRLDVTDEPPTLPALRVRLPGVLPLILGVGLCTLLLIALTRPRRTELYDGVGRHDLD